MLENKPKNEELNFLYLDQKNIKQEKKDNKNKPKTAKKKRNTVSKASNTKEGFDFNDEIVIGVTKPSSKETTQKKATSKKVESKKKANTTKQNSKVKKGAEATSARSKKNIPAKKEPRNNKTVTGIIKWTVLLIALFASFIFFMMSPLFDVVEISVINNEKINAETISSLSGVELGQNIYQTSKGKIQKNIKQNAYIESVTVTRKLPNKLELSIKERKTTYRLEIAGSYAYINNQGYILEITQQQENIPVLIGYQTPQEEIKAGNRLHAEDLERLAMVLKIVESANGNSIGELITRIDISDKQNYTLVLEGKKKIIYLGDASNLSNRMLYAKAIIEKEEGLEGEIFVKGDLNKENAFFRQKE